MTAAARRIGTDERRARLARRHHLAPPARAAHVVEVARDLVALHGTDPASVFLAAWARMRAPEVAAIELALYKERALVRMLGMRRTMFVVPVELAPVVQASCTRAIAVQQRKLLVRLLEQAGVADDPGAGSARSRTPPSGRSRHAGRRSPPSSPRTSRACASSSCSPRASATRPR